MRVIKKICALTVCFLIVFQVASVSAEATETAKIKVDSVKTYKNSIFSVSIFAENLKNVASLDMTAFYDSSVLTLCETDVGSLISGAFASVNSDVSGQVSLSMATTTSISGDGQILTLSFEVKQGVAPQTTKINVAVGDAYNSSFYPVSISGEAGNVEIIEVTEISDVFYLHSYETKKTLVLNDTTKVSVFNSNFYSFASADFTFEYNPEYFELVSANLSGALLEEGAIYSCNTDIKGLAKISYASTNEISTSELFTIELRMIKDVEFSDSTTISFSCQNVTKANLSIYQAYKSTTSFDILGADGSIYIDSEDFVKGLTAKSVVKFSADTFVAAGDFIISYDPAHISPVSVTANEEAITDGGMIMINPNFKNGEIKFSYVNENGLTSAVSLLDVVWKVSLSGEHTQITPYSTSLVDADYNKINLRYADAEECLFSYNSFDVDAAVHPHLVIAKCNKCERKISVSVPGFNCTSCASGYVMDTENTKIDYDKKLVFAQTDFHTDLKNLISLPETASVTSIPSVSYNDNCFYGTGSKITIYKNEVPVTEYTLVVMGDVNGDSVCDVLDCMLVELARHSANQVSLSGAYLLAGDFATDAVIDENDLNAVVNKALS